MDAPHAQLCAECVKVVQGISVYNTHGSASRPLADLCATISSCSLCWLTNRAFQDAGFDKDLAPCDENDEEGRRLLQARFFQFWVRSADVKDPVQLQQDDLPGICVMEIKYDRNSHDYHSRLFNGFETYVRFSAQPDSPAAASGKVYAGPEIAASGSPESFAHLNQLYAGCIAQHEECRKTLAGALIDEDQEPTLPTRILDLGDPSSSSPPSSIRLLQTDGTQRGHYAALSYCWGQPAKHPPITTSANLAAHASGIPVDELPQTFRDAVGVARGLGLRYLWIDALCILQDARDDWRREAARMGPVYSRARVVIAAADAKDPSEGIFRTYPQRTRATLPFINVDGKADGVMTAELRPRESVLDPDKAALNARAWATQEYILGRRVVYFTAGATVWSCRRLPRSALWDDGVLYYAAGRTKTDWPRIVEEYSPRQLSFVSDTLVALEGMVAELREVRRAGKKAQEGEEKQVDYAYGLWTDALATHLMWSRLGSPGSMTRPAELRDVAPTWSWASTAGGAGMMSEDRFGDDGPEARAELTVDGRKIKVKGRLGRVELRIIEKPDPYLHPCDFEVRSEAGEMVGLASTDVGLGEGVKTATVDCLIAMFHPHNFEDGSYLTLFVQPQEDGSDHYVRVGNGMIINKEWADQLEESELYLV